jgi:hypothetical protein
VKTVIVIVAGLALVAAQTAVASTRVAGSSPSTACGAQPNHLRTVRLKNGVVQTKGLRRCAADQVASAGGVAPGSTLGVAGWVVGGALAIGGIAGVAIAASDDHHSGSVSP